MAENRIERMEMVQVEQDDFSRICGPVKFAWRLDERIELAQIGPGEWRV
jgi:hypothetical protein